MAVSQLLKDLNVISFEKKIKPLHSRHLLIADTFLGSYGVCYREVPLYICDLQKVCIKSAAADCIRGFQLPDFSLFDKQFLRPHGHNYLHQLETNIL